MLTCIYVLYYRDLQIILYYTSNNNRRYRLKNAYRIQVIYAMHVVNYKYCDEYCIFKGIVGRELLWPTLSAHNKAVLRFTKVLELNRVTKLYKLSFRDEITFELSGSMLDRASTRDEHILAGTVVSLDVEGDEPSLVVFKAAHINEAKAEMGRYKSTGPEMAVPGPFESDFSSDSQSSGEDSESSTASVHAAVIPKRNSRERLGGPKIAGTPDDTTQRAREKQLDAANASLSAFQGDLCKYISTLCTGSSLLYIRICKIQVIPTHQT
jgi:hypothetical protein